MQDAHSYEMKGILIGTIALIYLLTFFILRASTKIGKRIGRDGKQCNDAPHGIDSDGNCGGMFRQRIETDFGGYCERGDASLMIKDRRVEESLK